MPIERRNQANGPRAAQSIERMVSDFYTLLKWPTRTTPTASIPPREIYLLRQLFAEEVTEFTIATENRDIEKIADAIADIVYVAYGAANQFGISLRDQTWTLHQARMREWSARAGDAAPKARRSPPTVTAMVSEWYRLGPWPVRTRPTADIDEEEIRLLARQLSEGVTRFGTATELGDIEMIGLAIASINYAAFLAGKHFAVGVPQVVAAVHQANMSKRYADGLFHLDASGKVMRGPRYRAPDMHAVLYPPSRSR